MLAKILTDDVRAQLSVLLLAAIFALQSQQKKRVPVMVRARGAVPAHGTYVETNEEL
jgi:hypothetical protein